MGNEFTEWFSDFLDFTFPKLAWYGYIVNSAFCFICVLFAGLMAGLTLGLLSFDKMSLEILIASGTPWERRRARCIYSVVRHHHWLLVTLLVWNAIAMEALPLFLDKMVPGAIAILLSVTFILLFGEIIPQAICSRYALTIGYFATVGVWLLMIVSCPISLPISFILDCLLGKHEITFYKRAGLSELVAKHQGSGDKGHGPLSDSEIKTIRGALETNEKTVSHPNVMTVWEDVYMLNKDSVLSIEKIEEIISFGHSRIPVYHEDRQNVVGLLLVKELLTCLGKDLNKCSIGDLKLRKLPAVDSKFTLWEILHIFKTGNTHMALVYEKRETQYYADAKDINFVGYIGIVTLEEVIEELIQIEIDDEKDYERKQSAVELKKEEEIDIEIGKNKTAPLKDQKEVADFLRALKLQKMKEGGLKSTVFETPGVKNVKRKNSFIGKNQNSDKFSESQSKEEIECDGENEQRVVDIGFEINNNIERTDEKLPLLEKKKDSETDES